MVAAPRLQRSEGVLRIGFKSDGSLTRLDALYQSGCLKARFPRCFAAPSREAVLINTAGGLTDDDRLDIRSTWQCGASAVVATQAAERIYRCRSRPARITTALDVADGAVAAWLPQETIVFDGAHLDRDTRVDVAAEGRFFGVESFVFGRAAMGEVVSSGSVFDRWRVYRDGQLVFADAFSLGEIDSPCSMLERPAIAGGRTCTATAIFVGDPVDGPADGHSMIERLRGCATASDAEAGISDLGGVVVMRLVAADSRIMRRLILQFYNACLADDGFTEPRVWHC